MKRGLFILRIGVAFLVFGAISTRAALQNAQTYYGMCGASAAVALDDKHFVVGDDESSSLRVYERGVPRPIRSFDVNRFLTAHHRGHETDLEGAARVGDLIYWIGSHGRHKDGEEAPSRRQFFAVRIIAEGKILDPVGKSYTGLLTDILADARFDKYHFAEAARLAPKEKGGLNIEGLSARPDGSLLIGFRSPLQNGKSLLLPLLNPQKVIEGERAQLGDMIELDLDGLGVRDMTLDGDRFLIVAGEHHSGKRFELFSWDGTNAVAHVKGVKFGKMNPEAIFRFAGDAPSVFQILSDDSGEEISDKKCGDLSPSKRRFRAGEITVR